MMFYSMEDTTHSRAIATGVACAVGVIIACVGEDYFQEGNGSQHEIMFVSLFSGRRFNLIRHCLIYGVDSRHDPDLRF